MTFNSHNEEDKNRIFSITKLLFNHIAIYHRGREAYFGEFRIGENVFKSLSSIDEISKVFCISYGVCRDVEKLIVSSAENDTMFKQMLGRAIEQNIGDDSEKDSYITILCEHIESNMHLVPLIEESLWIKYNFIESYYSLFNELNNFISSVSPLWNKYLTAVAEANYLAVKERGGDFIYNSISPITEDDLNWLTSPVIENTEMYNRCISVLEKEEADEPHGKNERVKNFIVSLSGDGIRFRNIKEGDFKDFVVIRQLNVLLYNLFNTEMSGRKSVKEASMWISKVGKSRKGEHDE